MHISLTRRVASVMALLSAAFPAGAGAAADTRRDADIASIHRIDAATFDALPRAPRTVLRRIKDPDQAEAALAGRVRFVRTPGIEELQLAMITLPDGRTLDANGELPGFVAYYPDEDIVLLRGGHESDMAYALRSGEDIERSGNPEYILTSPDAAYRLNGWFPGQECSEYFLQRSADSAHIHLLSLNALFDSTPETGESLCTITDAFWSDARTLNFRRTAYAMDAEYGVAQFFQLRIRAQ